MLISNSLAVATFYGPHITFEHTIFETSLIDCTHKLISARTTSQHEYGCVKETDLLNGKPSDLTASVKQIPYSSEGRLNIRLEIKK